MLEYRINRLKYRLFRWLCGDLKDEVGKMRVRFTIEGDRQREITNRIWEKVTRLEEDVRWLNAGSILKKASDRRFTHGD